MLATKGSFKRNLGSNELTEVSNIVENPNNGSRGKRGENEGSKKNDYQEEAKDGLSPLQTMFSKTQIEKPKKKGR